MGSITDYIQDFHGWLIQSRVVIKTRYHQDRCAAGFEAMPVRKMGKQVMPVMNQLNIGKDRYDPPVQAKATCQAGIATDAHDRGKRPFGGDDLDGSP